MDNYAFETIAMRHLVPGLAHKDAFALTSMAQSLGSNEEETLLVYQTAIEGRILAKKFAHRRTG